MTEVPVSSSLVDEGGANPRARWTNRRDYLLTMAGQMFNLRTFLIFPFSVYYNGGCKSCLCVRVCVSLLLLISLPRLPGAFFIPYGFALFFIIFPLFVLETAVGQFTSRAGAAAWRMICPMFHGEWCSHCGPNDTHTHSHRLSPVAFLLRASLRSRLRLPNHAGLPQHLLRAPPHVAPLLPVLLLLQPSALDQVRRLVQLW